MDRYTSNSTLTWDDARKLARTERSYTHLMKMVARDLDVIRLVGAFSQLTAGQVAAVLFRDNASATPCNRVLRRLAQDKMLSRITRRLPGGPKGGSPQYVYQLGPEGWRLFSRTRWRPRTAVDYHALAIADAYVALLDSGASLGLEVKQVITEPDTHTSIAGADLRPDLFVAVEHRATGRIYHLWLEIDMGTERPKQLTEMLERYVHAWHNSGTFDELDQHGNEVEVQRGQVPFPRVVFLVPNDERVRVIEGLVRRQDEDVRRLFTVLEFDGFPQGLMQ